MEATVWSTDGEVGMVFVFQVQGALSQVHAVPWTHDWQGTLDPMRLGF